jgi:hypothetical protein
MNGTLRVIQGKRMVAVLQSVFCGATEARVLNI